MSGMGRKGGGAGAVCPLYSVAPCPVVQAIYVVQGVLCGVVLFLGFWQVGEGRGCGWEVMGV